MNKINTHNNIIYYNKLLKNYYIEKKIESGIVLCGWQIKSLRHKRLDASKCYITIIKQEVFLKNLYIQPLQHHFNLIKYQQQIIHHKLLLHKNEIYYLENNIKQKGYTIILICLYLKRNICKALISLAKGKKKFDKRKEIKNKEWKIKEARLNKNFI